MRLCQIRSSYPVHGGVSTVPTMHPRDQLAARVRAILDAVDADEPETLDHHAIAVVLPAIGDAVRLGVALPTGLARVVAALSRRDLGSICTQWVTELEDTRIPAPDDEAAFEDAVAARDRSESARIGAIRICVARGWAPGQVDEYVQLAAACARFDQGLLERATTETIGRALGDRAWLDEGAPWYARDTTDDAGRAAEPPAAEPSDATSEVPALRPPIAAVAEYLERGTHHHWIERAAARDASFAMELADHIEQSLADHEPVSFMARRWLHGRGASKAFVLPVQRPLAAARDEKLEPEEIPLGRLSPIEAEARIVLESTPIFELDAEPGVIASVALGAVEITAPGSDGAWRIAIERWEGPLSLRITGCDGSEIAADLELELVNPEAD